MFLEDTFQHESHSNFQNNCNDSVIIKIIERISESVLKVMLSDGSFFLFRTSYLSEDSLKNCTTDTYIAQDTLDSFAFAAKCYEVEKKAMYYLARTEYCSYQLKTKLKDKGFPKDAIEAVIEYLQSKNYVSDERYCEVWLRNRTKNHFESKTILLQSLIKKGVNKKIAENAIKNFFEENDEDILLDKAVKKMIRMGKTKEQILASLYRKGFSITNINEKIKINSKLV